MVAPIALFALLVHSQDLLVAKIDQQYIPKLAAIEQDIKAARLKTADLLKAENREDQKRALEANRDSQRLADDAAKGYRRYLLQQREQVAKARQRATHDLRIADNTFETVEASFQLRNLMKDSAASFEALHEAGIETLLLKGAPLAILRYGSPGLRPMADVDILVPTDRALAAIRLLRELGWDSIDHPDPERRIELRHSEGFRRRSDGALIDLHWNALMQPFRDDDLWSAAIDVEIGGVPTRAPCATDQLLLVTTPEGTLQGAVRSPP